MTKVQLRVLRHMLLLKAFLQRKTGRTWCYLATGGEIRGTTIRQSTVDALIKGGYAKPGENGIVGLTVAGIYRAQNAIV